MSRSPADAVPKISWLIPSVFGLTVLVVLAITTFFIPIKADDIWWHLKTGELILSAFSLPQENIFSFTAPGHAWLPHEWLAEVFFTLIYQHLGPMALIAFGVLLNGVSCALVYKLAARYSRSPYLSSIITLVAALMMLGNFSLRPYLFGNVFFICTLHAMEDPSAGGRIRPVLVFLLFAAWANFHGSFIIGLALILLYMSATITRGITQRQRGFAQTKSYLKDLAVALVACMVTPNHVFGLIFPLIYVQKAFSSEVNFLTNISEWQPANMSSPLGQMVTFLLMFCGFAIIGSRKSPKPIHIGLLVAFATFAYTSIRNIPLLGIAVVPILARHLPPTLGRAWKTLTQHTPLVGFFDRLHENSLALERRSRAVVLPMLGSILVIIVFALPSSNPASYTAITGNKDLADLSPSFYPRSILAALEQPAPKRKIFNYFNWGGAFIWAMYPRERVFIDQRNDCYPINIFRDYFAVHRLERDWREVLDRWQIDTVAYPRDSSLSDALRKEPGWQVALDNAEGVIFTRDPPGPIVP